MKKAVSIILTFALLLSLLSAFGIGAGATDVLPQATAVALEKSELSVPTADGTLDLDVGYKFVSEHDANTVIDFAKNNKYANCPMDFVITSDKDIRAGAVTLAGFYAHHDSNWVAMTPDSTFAAGTQMRLLQVIPGGPYNFTYIDVATYVKEFFCGAKLNDTSAAGATMTVSLCVFPDGEDPIVINSFSYTFQVHEHTWSDWTVSVAAVSADCIHPGKTATETRRCSECGETETRGGDEIPATGAHNYTMTLTKPATFEEDGVAESKCTVCGGVEPETEPTRIAKIASVELSETVYIYDDTAKTPDVTVKDADGNEIAAKNYSVVYYHNVKVGTSVAAITFQDNYSGSVEKEFHIVLARPVLKLHDVSSRAVALTWSKIAGAEYYKVYEYNAQTKSYRLIAKTTALHYTVQGKAAATKYNYVIRACFMTLDGTKEVGSLSNAVNAFTRCKVPNMKASVSKSTVTLKWTKSSGAKFYRVYKYNTKTHKYSVLVSSTTKTALTLKNQPKGNNYYLVRAFNSNSVGSQFTTAHFAKAAVK